MENHQNPYRFSEADGDHVWVVEELTNIPVRGSYEALRSELPGWLSLPVAMFLRLRGVVNWPMRPQYAFRFPDTSRLVDFEDIPPEALEELLPMVDDFRDIGFTLSHWESDYSIGARHQVSAFMVDSMEEVLVNVERCHIPDTAPYVTVELNSFPMDDPVIMTVASADDNSDLAAYFMPDFVDYKFFDFDHSLEHVYEVHRARLGGEVTPVTMGNAAMISRNSSNRRLGELLKKGVVRRLSAAEIESVKILKLPDAVGG